MSRRVVVTGLGLVTPLGVGVRANWESLLAGVSGVGPITRFDASALSCRVAGEVRDFDANRWIPALDQRRMDRFILFALAASLEAAMDARLVVREDDAPRVGVAIGVGLGGLPGIEDAHSAFLRGGPRRVSPYFIPSVIGNLAPGQVAMRLGLRGPNLTTTTACASGAHAVGEAFEMVAGGRADVMLAGGAEAAVTPLALAGFGTMGALSRWDGPAAAASRPFDRKRSGFVMAEGAGVLVLESEERARRRRAPVLAEVLGYGASADAYHLTQPAEDGLGAQLAIRQALERAKLPPTAVQHVNAHATSTPQGDVAETRALKAVFGPHADRLLVSATKSLTGHLLGAAGAVEAAYTVLALRNQVAPPTANLDDPDPDCDLDYVPHRPRRAPITAALSTSFGFGGTNAALLFGRAGGAAA